MNNNNIKNLDKLLEKIAQERLNIETLNDQNRDGLDFHEVSVRGIKLALADAYNLGVNSTLSVLPDLVEKHFKETSNIK